MLEVPEHEDGGGMNHRQLYWKYRRMKEVLERSLDQGLLAYADWKFLAEVIFVKGQIALLEQLMGENEW